MRCAENVILGLDIGIGSVGWALIKEDPVSLEKSFVTRTLPHGEVQYAYGVRLVSVPEDPKTKELLNVKRRTARMQRRIISRRAQRLRQLRNLLFAHGMDNVMDPQQFHTSKGVVQLDPWKLRQEAVQRQLSADEFACVLLHLAKHRGFKSNSKRDGAAKDAESGKILKAVGQLKSIIQEKNITVGTYLADTERKRNRCDYKGKAVYEHTMLRSLLEDESRSIFACQQSFGNILATDSLLDVYLPLAFHQRPLASTANMVGNCVFMEQEKRAPRFAPTAERFRLAQKLTILRLKNADGQVLKLEAEGIKRVLELLGTQRGISYKSVRKVLKLPNTSFFDGLNYGSAQDSAAKQQDPESRDIATRTGDCGLGTYTFKKILGDHSFVRLAPLRVAATTEFPNWLCLDALAKIISDNDDVSKIEELLHTLPVQKEEREAVLAGVKKGDFALFKGTMNMSVKAMEAIVPHMIAEGDYAMGCELAGFDHSKEKSVSLEDIRNPVVLRILREVRQQMTAIMRTFDCIPGRVHVEFLRDVGKSVEERNCITKGLEERTKVRDKLRKSVAEIFGIAPEEVSGTEILRYELWKAQEGKCAYHVLWRHAGGERVYTGEMQGGAIPPQWLQDGVHNVQIDHILPRSRTFDNSFHNLCLSCVSANQAKGGQSPYEWIGKENPTAWHEFSAWIKQLPIKGFKKRNFLLEKLDEEVQGRFHARNLTDSSYIARLVKKYVEDMYVRKGISMEWSDGNPRKRVFVRPGQVTDFLRKEWGVQSLKKDTMGIRQNDKHHALDALIIACCSEGMLQRVVKVFQLREQQQSKRSPVPLPWENFRDDCVSMLAQLFVSRAERGRTKGALHEETLRGVRKELQQDGTEKIVLYTRKIIDKISMEDLEKIKDSHRCPDVIAALKAWLEGGKPKDALPCLQDAKTGELKPIRHVRVMDGEYKSGVFLQRGSGMAQASNGKIVRTDVYSRAGKYYLVPVYTWDIARGIVPDKACVGGKLEADWLPMDVSCTFCFSLIPDCYVLTEDKKGVKREGYYVGMNRATASITLSLSASRQELIQSIGVQNLKIFHKYRIDRMGNRSRVKQEKKPGCAS